MFDITQLAGHVPPEIYKRGLSYYQQQLVTGLYESSKGKWTALVSGTEDYEVRIQTEGSILRKATCTCPYDAPVCKHIVAVLLAIMEESGTLQDGQTKGAGAKKKAAGKNKTPDMGKALQQLTKEELQNLVQQYAAQSREFRSFLAIHLLSKSNPAGKESYRQLIQHAVKPFVRRGFIEYADSLKAMKPLVELADEADAQLQKGFYREAADISSALIEELAGIIGYMDDSAGFVTDISSAAFSVLHAVTDSDAPYSLKEEIFSYALQERKKKKYQGWDWTDDFFELAVAAARDEAQYRQLLQETEASLQQANMKRETWTKEYEIQNWLNRKMAVLAKMGKAGEAQTILQQHLDIPDFRRQAVQQNLAAGRLNEAAALCEEALQRKIGQQNLWYEILLGIAQRRKNTEGIRKWALQLFLKTAFALPFFRVYRSTFAPAEWSRQRERLLSAAGEKTGPYYDAFALAHLYVEEKMWDELLAACQAHPDLERLQQFDSYLLPQFRHEMLWLYEKALVKYAAEKQGRAHYTRIRKVMNGLQKIKGGDELAGRLVQQFRQRYKQRRAMMEELDRLVL